MVKVRLMTMPGCIEPYTDCSKRLWGEHSYVREHCTHNTPRIRMRAYTMGRENGVEIHVRWRQGLIGHFRSLGGRYRCLFGSLRVCVESVAGDDDHGVRSWSDVP